MIKGDHAYLLHICECIRRIEENSAVGREGFLASHTFQDAILRNLQTMTEATQRISATLKEQYPEVEWQRIAAFRNILVHDYLGIDLERVWEISRRDIPVLKRAALAMLQRAP